MKVLLSISLREIKINESSSEKSEEHIEAGIDIIFNSLNNSYSDVIEEFYKEESIPILSNICLEFVKIIENHKKKKLKEKTVQCLMLLYFVDSSCDFDDKLIRNQAANCLYLFIPKIIKILVQIATGDAVLGDQLKTVRIPETSLSLITTYFFTGIS